MSGGHFNPERIGELERALGRIPAVGAARAVLSSTGAITEVHVVANEDRSPKLIVRDIQSVARAMFDLEIDYRKVSVVHLPEADAASVLEAVPAVAPAQAAAADVTERPAQPAQLVAVEPVQTEPPAVEQIAVEPVAVEPVQAELPVEPPSDPPAEPETQPVRMAPAVHAAPAVHVEPSVARIVISQSGALTEVAVHLAGPGAEGSASVRGPSSQVAMLAARAALAARESLGAEDAATVAGVEESAVAGRRVVIVAAIVAGAAGEAFATACAPVTGSVAEAAAAAALQAVAGRVG